MSDNKNIGSASEYTAVPYYTIWLYIVAGDLKNYAVVAACGANNHVF
jgi:hypothetical protein